MGPIATLGIGWAVGLILLMLFLYWRGGQDR